MRCGSRSTMSGRVGVVLVVLALLAAACSGSGDGDDVGSGADGSSPGGDGGAGDEAGEAVETGDEAALVGLVPTDEWRARQDEFLTWATDENDLIEGAVLSIMAFAERARRDPDFTWDDEAPNPEAMSGTFEKLINYEDTGDFDINRFLYLLAGWRDDIPDDLAAALDERVLAFKYWWTEPTPDGIVDSQYYWTENHQIIFLANEYIAGQMFPDEVFSNSGMTGAEHMAHAEPLLREWIENRARFGFSEWLSNVYYMEDLKGLLLLAEWADDPEIANLASMALDMMFVELASHTQAGAFGATHGRSYMKDKMTALTEDSFTLAKMLFDDTDYDYVNVDNATLLATANRYRPPQVIREIAATDEVGVVQQRQSLPLDPTAPIEADPEAPYGFDFSDPENLAIWWGMGAQLTWQMVPVSIDTIETYDLWRTSNFQRAGDLEPIVASSTTEELEAFALQLAYQLNPGLLSEANTYTWRSPDAMLSTAQCWRPGQRGEQNHTWQATLDANAQVFTTNPRAGVPPAEDSNSKEGYWTGDGAMPCSLQYNNVGISIYAPQYDGSAEGPFFFEDFTHAYFPTENFDEVVERDGWVVGRLGDGYVAIWSWRPAEWRDYDPATEYTRDLTERFDLVASGGADNVWIVEVGRAADFDGDDDPFALFVDAVTASEPEVTPLGGAERTAGSGFGVSYASPTQGSITAELDVTELTDFSVDGSPVEVKDYDRWNSPWAQSAFDSQVYEVDINGWSLLLDFTTGTRTTSAP